jgi:hypothetical protein
MYVSLATALFTSAGVISRSLPAEQEALVLTGYVRVAASPDGSTTLVSIDTDSPGEPPDGLVDHAFRLQHQEPARFDFDGIATISYTQTSLALQPENDIGWVFSLSGVPENQDEREHPVAASPGCCQTPMGGDGCEDTYAGACRSEGECHSQMQKSCDIGWFSCSWEFDENCPPIEGR